MNSIYSVCSMFDLFFFHEITKYCFSVVLKMVLILLVVVVVVVAVIAVVVVVSKYISHPFT